MQNTEVSSNMDSRIIISVILMGIGSYFIYPLSSVLLGGIWGFTENPVLAISISGLFLVIGVLAIYFGVNMHYLKMNILFKTDYPKWTYLLPIFISLIGVIIAYFMLKGENKDLAKNFTYAGIMIVLISVSVSYVSMIILTYVTFSIFLPI